MRAIVTGGAGFIGSHLADALVARGDDVVVVDDVSSGKREHLNPSAAFLERDIRDGLDLAGVDVVFHLAAQADVQTSVRRPSFDADVNVRGTVEVLEAARAAGAHVVFTSTGGAIYGECVEPAAEDAPRLPVSPYGIAKLCAEEYLVGWNRIHGSGHVVLRLANVYGPRQDSSLEGGVVSIFLERMLRGDETVIFGDGLQERDFVYVGDVVEALLAAGHRRGGVFNVGTGAATSVLDLHAACRAVAGTGAEARFEAARLGDARRSVLDVALAQRELGWRAGVGLDDGLGRTWDWLRGS
jgi:UDP-glucose 4-epimerase